jgi:hypothetical protein
MNKYANQYFLELNKKTAESHLSLGALNQPSPFSGIIEKIRMKNLPHRLQMTIPGALIGGGIGGISSSINEATKSDEDRMNEKMTDTKASAAKNIIESIINGGLIGVLGGSLYTSGRDSKGLLGV